MQDSSEKEKNYNSYLFQPKELLILLIESMVLTIFISYLFYKSVYALFAWVLIFPILFIKKRKKKIVLQKEKLAMDFKETMLAVSTALGAGYSIENSFCDAQKELIAITGEESDMLYELRIINAKTGLNQPIEDLILDFSVRSSVEDIILFGQILYFAKRSGGDFVGIIRNATEHIAEKIEVQKEISIMIAQKKLEQKIMNVIPLFIIFYMNVSSPKYLDILYGNLMGIIIMSICVAFYFAAILLSEYIIDIKV